MRTSAQILFLLLWTLHHSLAGEMRSPVKIDGSVPSIINGVPQAPENWPATMIFEIDGEGGCTSTIVGAKVIITAAHCIKGATEDFTIALPGTSTTAKCTAHPFFGLGDRTQDFALCLTDIVLSGVIYENISASIARPMINESIVLLGFGCISNSEFDRSFGVLFKGLAKVSVTPSDDSTTTRSEGAALCYGDSGGAAYYNTRDTDRYRYIFGINSRSDISSESIFASTATKNFVEWAIKWSLENKVTICGIHPLTKGCRPV